MLEFYGEDLDQSSGFGKVLRFLCRLEFYDEALDQSSELGQILRNDQSSQF